MTNKSHSGYGVEYPLDIAFKLILFVLSPFLGLIYSLCRPNTKSSLVLFFIFGLVFGMALTVTPYLTFDAGAYVKKFHEVLSFTKWESGADSLFDNVSFYKDYYVFLVAYFSAQLSDSYHLFFFLLSIPFNFFAILSLNYFVKQRYKVNVVAFYVLLMFFLTNHYFGINGVRFWTAAWVGIYIALKVFVDKNYKYLGFIVILPLIHASFYFYILIVSASLGVIWFKLFKAKLFLLIFIISILVTLFGNSLLLPIIKSLTFLNSFYAEAYLDQAYMQEFNESRGDYSSLGNTFRVAFKLYINALFLVMIYNAKIIERGSCKDLFVLLYVWMIFTNLVIFIPSLGERSMKMLMPIMAYILIVNFKELRFSKVVYLFPVVYIFESYLAFLRYTTVLEKDFYYTNIIFIVNRYLF